jgi:beta-fructofuranosidase
MYLHPFSRAGPHISPGSVLVDLSYCDEGAGMVDPHRPRYHFLAPSNWMNDPNGLIQWKGVYHLFYQHNPTGAIWGNMHWGHAASRDLVHWEHLPIALAPTPGGPDQSGVWSGSAVVWDGQPAMVYTGRDGENESVCIAVSQDDMRTLYKHPANPVIPFAPSELPQVGFRDPCLWREDGLWKMVIGSGFRGQGGAILLFASPDLLHWQYLGPLVTGDARQTEPVWTGEMWECPNFFPLGGQHALIISPMDLHPSRSLYTLYMTGDYQGNRFIPRVTAKMDGGDVYFYAPQAFLDDRGRRIIFGWSREARSDAAGVRAGWAGVMSIPRVLNLAPDGKLYQHPVPELKALRGEVQAWEDLWMRAGEAEPVVASLPGLSGDAFELELEWSLAAGQGEGEFGLLVRRSPGDEEVTEIRIDAQAGALVVDTLHSSLDPETSPGVYEIPLDLRGQDVLHMRVFLDASILEVYANDLSVITARLYPSRPDSQGIALFARRAPALAARVRAWEMRAA